MEKALWVVRDRITNARTIDDLLADTVERGIRDLVVQVRGRGDAYYRSALEPLAEPVEEGFDPLAHLAKNAAVVGVRIHAWGNDWEGIYADPASAAVREHTLAVFADIVTRYPVEGFHYDYVRYPQARYATSPEDRRHVTELVRSAAPMLRAARPGLVISAAVFPDPSVARDRVLQEWPRWAAEGLIDLVCPMAYRQDTAEVARLLGLARAAAPATRLWAGLMGYAGKPDLLHDQVRAAESAGCEGAILFAYDPAQPDLLDAFAAA